MIYLTQLIFVKPGQEEVFHEFESHAIPLLTQYGGELIYRIRPTKDAFIEHTEEVPYEIHFLSFPSDSDFEAFKKDDSRLAFLHLKEASIRRSFLVKGRTI